MSLKSTHLVKSIFVSLLHQGEAVVHSERTLPDTVVWRQNLYCRIYQLTKTEDATLLPTLKTPNLIIHPNSPFVIWFLCLTHFVVLEIIRAV